MSAYRFDKPDWLSSRLPVWEELLLPLAGQPRQILEIGSYEGRSAVWFAENLIQHEDAHLTCVDPCIDAAVAANLRANIETAGRAIRLIVGLSADVLSILRGNHSVYDLVYIDGSHEAPDVLLDLVLSFELLKPGGLLIADDYQWSDSLDGTVHAPQLAINAFAAVYRERLALVHRDVQAWFRKL
jgi:predicted O-methyltransferase YrrM